MEKWCYLLRKSDRITKEECEYLSRDKEIKMAINHLNKLSKDEELYQEAFSRQMSLTHIHLEQPLFSVS